MTRSSTPGHLSMFSTYPRPCLTYRHCAQTEAAFFTPCPPTNYCGHGFWQFSPELFFSLYSEKNGYSDIRIFLVSLDDWDTWYECVKPNGSRGEFRSIGRAPLLIMAATTKSGAFSHQDVQQSDYIAAWNADEESNYRPTGFREKIKNTAWWPLARRVDYALRALKAPSEDFMIRRQVSSLLS